MCAVLNLLSGVVFRGVCCLEYLSFCRFVVLSVRASVNVGIRVFVVCVFNTVGKGLRLTV